MEENVNLYEDKKEEQGAQEQESKTNSLTLRDLFRKIGDIKVVSILHFLGAVFCIGLVVCLCFCFVECFDIVTGRYSYSYKFWDADLWYSFVAALFGALWFGCGLYFASKSSFWPFLCAILYFALFIFTIEFWDYMNINCIELQGVSNSLLGGISLGLLIFIALFSLIVNVFMDNVSESSDSSADEQEDAVDEDAADSLSSSSTLVNGQESIDREI